LHTPHHQISRVYKKMGHADLTFLPRSIRVTANTSKRKLAPTTPPVINPPLRILCMDSGDGGAAGTVAVATSARKSKEKRPREASQPSRSQTTLGQPGVETPPRTGTVDGGVRHLEFAGGTPSPHEKAQGKEASFLYRPDRKKAFAAVKGRRDVEAQAVAEDVSDDDEGASVGRSWTGQDPDNPADWAGNGRKTRAIKGGRSAAVRTSWPKAGQDPDDPADWAGDGTPPRQDRPWCPPRVGAASPSRLSTKMAKAGTRSPFASKDKFASEEGDNEPNSDKDIAAAAQLALGVEELWPSNEARTAVAKLPACHNCVEGAGGPPRRHR
jgi:hypothetical protein